MLSLFFYDPTEKDPLSSVRGIGRYLKVLREAFPGARFSSELSQASKYDIFFNPFCNITQPPLLMRRVAKRQIVVIHDVIPLLYPKHFPLGIKGSLNVFLHKTALRSYDIVLTDSEKSKKDIIQFLNIRPEKISVIYPALSQEFFGPSKKTTSEFTPPEKYCIYVGDATWNKNLVALAQSVIISDLSCICVGQVFSRDNKSVSHPWQEELKRFLTVVRDNPQFIFPGFISDPTLRDLYKNAVCNLLVSRDEGFGYSYFEAASQDTPSVLSDIPVLRETAGKTALFAPYNDPEAIADQILRFAKDPILRNRMGALAKKNTQKASLAVFKKSLQAAF